MKPVRRAHEHEVRVLDAQQGIVEYVASDQTLDSYREIIAVNGWKFDRFARNAPFVDSHDYYSIEKQLGRVLSYEVKGGQLIERVQWALDILDDNPLVRIGWKMTVGKFLKAVSVGFVPERSVGKWDDAKDMADAVKALGLDAETAAKVHCIYLQQQQIELSSCIIGANPNALAKAHEEGCVRDADLDAIGFDDDGMQMLRDFGTADDQAPEQVRPLIRRLWGDYTTTLSVKRNPQSATSAIGRAAAEEARQREQASFLAEFRKLTRSI